MSQVLIPLSGHRVEFKCDRCDKGYFKRVEHTKPVLEYPLHWPHKCSHCGLDGLFPTAYPVFRATTQGNIEKDFILRDEVPVPHGPRTNINVQSNTFKMVKQSHQSPGIKNLLEEVILADSVNTDFFSFLTCCSQWQLWSMNCHSKTRDQLLLSARYSYSYPFSTILVQLSGICQ